LNPDPVLRPERDEEAGADAGLDQALRPRNFDEFVGQRALLSNLLVAVKAAHGRGEALDHLLLSGLPGLGKTTLAHLVARAMGAAIVTTSGPALVRTAELATMLTSLDTGQVLFIDEIHRLPTPVEESLYSAMEDFSLDIVIDKGAFGRSVRVPLKRFTLIGATTREGMLSAPLRSRFGLLEKLDLYPAGEISQILRNSAQRLGVVIDDDAVARVARVARGTPRIANRLVKRLRDFAQVAGADRITAALAGDSLVRLGIDEHGLTETDRRILIALHRAGGGPVGLKTVAVAVGEDPETVEDVYEPFLLTEGWLLRTSRGRKLTDRAARWTQEREPGRGGGERLLF
jgi:Holliday junction DNA helicase RuvB